MARTDKKNSASERGGGIATPRFAAVMTSQALSLLGMEILQFVLPLHLLNLTGSGALYGGVVAYPITRDHGIMNVFFEIVYFQIGYRSDTSLCKISVGFFQSGFTNQCNRTFMCYFECKTHSGNSRADNEKIEFSNHKKYI